MSLKIVVLKETRPHETRVAMVPAVADKLAKLGAEIHMESGAGNAVKLADRAFKNVAFSSDRIALAKSADILLAVQPPELEIVEAMKEGAILVSFVHAQFTVVVGLPEEEDTRVGRYPYNRERSAARAQPRRLAQAVPEFRE